MPDAIAYTMSIKEYKTNIPLPGVKISLYACSHYDQVFGCQSSSIFATRITDNQGKYVFTQSELNQATEGITLSKSQYWDISGGPGAFFMEPEAWVQITLTAGKTYPDTSLFEIETVGDFNYGYGEIFKAPADSVINLRLLGNEMNTVKWAVFTKDLKCFQYCIRDTLAFGSLSLNPEKFEHLTATLNY